MEWWLEEQIAANYFTS